MPAIALARVGVVANATNRQAFTENRHRAFMAECFAFDEGDRGLRFRQPALASTLERLAERGARWLYEGPLVEAAFAAWRAAGIERREDDWREAVDGAELDDAAAFDLGTLRLRGAPLGLSGSACLFATAAAAERIAAERSLHDAEGLAALALAMASLWQYRFAMPTGNDFRGIDIHEWVERALAHDGSQMRPAAEAAHTAHLNAVDAEGTLVALTFTHGPAWFGGRWALPGTGVIMNGGMHNFSRAAPVKRNGRRYGVSNMSPTIATNAAGDRMALGGPGARRIPSNLGIVLARHFLAGEAIQAAVSGGRLHAEGRDCAWWERTRLPAALESLLAARFDRVEVEHGENYFGPLTAARVSAAGEVETAIDDRMWRGFASGVE
jgi:gamma-glutamyltranspeptidase/glutathione hydrolase